MKKWFSFFIALTTLFISSQAQSNVRGWYADGQVWIVWEASLPLPKSCAIYAKPTPFAHTDNATLVGRVFDWEYGAGALKEQLAPGATFRIPDGQGGQYQLALNEALFVATPHQAGALYFAVVACDSLCETAVTTGVNLTQNPVPFEYDPVGDPVECHLQAVFPSPFASNHTCQAYYMWADGRQNQWENRPDFPVMANAAKNGMPSLFMVGIPPGLDTTQPFPLTIWLHGGGGQARQSLPGSRPIVNIKPEKGITLTHNDDLYGWRSSVPPNPDGPSWHFGWRKNYNPFSSDNVPTEIDTIVNYTQRRYIWIDEWLIRHFNIDRNRININGHSMGSAGTTALAKVFPDHYASATLFNNGFGGPDPGTGSIIFGPPDFNFPTNLVNRKGETVHLKDLWNLIDHCAPQRDWPLFRSFHGKNDDNGTMRWDAYVVENYHHADSVGMGAQLLWSERAHGIDEGPNYNDHWHNGNNPDQQTAVDDVAYEENFRSDISYPAFFNNRLNPSAADPGDGTIGTGPNGVGDDWGSWGGYHRWNLKGIIDTPGEWSVVAWLENNSVFENDNCPDEQLTADLAIRKPQQFKPETGKTLNWNVEDAASGDLLQSGQSLVREDDLVVIPQIVVYRDDIRRVRVTISDPLVSAAEPAGEGRFERLVIAPNPSAGETWLFVRSGQEIPAEIRATAAGGQTVAFKTQLLPGENRVPLTAFNGLPPGFYTVSIHAGGKRGWAKWLKFAR